MRDAQASRASRRSARGCSTSSPTARHGSTSRRCSRRHAAIAGLSFLRAPGGGPRVAIAREEELREGEARYFAYPEGEQAMIVRMRGGELVAYSQRCPHLSCAVVYQDDRQRFFCPCHDGAFDVRSGVPTAGPPRRPLSRIRLERSGGVVYAVGVES